MTTSAKVKVATVWLSGCSGCHMSFLDQDERIIDLAKRIQLVYSPLADVKEYPENTDLVLIEGAVGNVEQLDLLRKVRDKTKILIALGDCAITANVTGLRNTLTNSTEVILERAYLETVDVNPQIPNDVPTLTQKAQPLHELVKVDFFIPGCPPPADTINYVLTELLSGRTPNMEGQSKYG